MQLHKTKHLHKSYIFLFSSIPALHSTRSITTSKATTSKPCALAFLLGFLIHAEMNADHHHLSRCNTCETQHRFLHNVRHLGAYLRLCSPCVLKSHPKSFCPNCLEPYTEHFSIDFIKCLKCCSIAHPTCVPADLQSRYLCPNCSKPGSSFSDFEHCSNKKARGINGESNPNPNGYQVLDVSSAKVLLTAAKIASLSMSRAAVIARFEADKRVREAVSARKKVREAIENVISIAARMKERKVCSDSVPSVEHKKKMKKQLQGSCSAMQRFHEIDKIGVEQRKIKNNVDVEKGKGKGSPVSVIKRPQILNRVCGDEKEKIETGVFLTTMPGVGQIQSVRNNSAVDENENLDAGEQTGMLERYVDSELQCHVDALKQLRVDNDGYMVSVPSLTGGSAGDVNHMLPHQRKDLLASGTNPGMIFTGSSNTTSLIS